MLAYLDRPGTSNGPTEAINGRPNTSAAPPTDSATSPTTSPDAYARPAGSEPDYTLHVKPIYSALLLQASAAHPGHGRGSGCHAKSLVDVVQMSPHGALGQPHPAGHLPVGVPLGNVLQELELPWG